MINFVESVKYLGVIVRGGRGGIVLRVIVQGLVVSGGG